MLGLGNSLISNNRVNLHFSYYSDFTSDDNGWTKSSSFHNGTPTITPNQGTGDAADGTGWLKIVYGADQRNFPFSEDGGIEREMILSPDSFKAGDDIVISYKIKLIHNGVDDHWDGTDNVDIFIFGVDNALVHEAVPLNTTKTYSNVGKIINPTINRKVKFRFTTATDKPKAGATWYLKDFSIQVFR